MQLNAFIDLTGLDKKQMKFLIVAPSYNENSGGIVVLHKLCHVLNEIGYDAYLYPIQHERNLRPNYLMIRDIASQIKFEIKRRVKKFLVCEIFNTPVLKSVRSADINEFIVVYPEVVSGNPLGAKFVVRWLLHQPGFHTGNVNYYAGELYYKFNSAIKDFYICGSKLSQNELKVIHYPLEIYNENGAAEVRSGAAYCIRKGRGKRIQHDLNESVLIDGKSHSEIAEIFKNCRMFVSYDTYTAYSLFAVLCGAKSIVIPDEGVGIDEWYPDPHDRNGIAYGFEQAELNRAQNTSHLVLERIRQEESSVVDRVSVFAQEAVNFFESRSLGNNTVIL